MRSAPTSRASRTVTSAPRDRVGSACCRIEASRSETSDAFCDSVSATSRARLASARLPGGRAGSANHGDERHGRRRDGRAVPSHELADAVRRRLGPSLDGQSVQVTLDIGAELGGPPVATVRIGAERLEDNPIEVAAEPPPQALGSRGAEPGGISLEGSSGRVGGDAAAGGSGCRDGVRGAGVAAGARAGQELVEQHAKAVDVRRRRDGAASGLLGSGVGRRQDRFARLCQVLVGVEQLCDPEVQ